MPFVPLDQARELAFFAEISDREVQTDLVAGYIANENDYTSNFTGTLRRNINAHSKTGLTATSYVLPRMDEKVMGCDAAIVLARGDRAKVLLIEAKWPRLSALGHQWDWRQTAAGQSHFSDQLDRQSHFAGRYAIIEMFYNEQVAGAQAKGMRSARSSCVWHGNAIKFDQSRTNYPNVWSQAELLQMLQLGTLSIGMVVTDLAACQQGTVMTLPLGNVPRLNLSDYPLPPNVLVVTAEGPAEPQEYSWDEEEVGSRTRS